jgi:hypothetical protein
VGETGAHPSNPVEAKTRRKLLITRRLWAFQFDAELPSFQQAIDWRKWETLWVIWSAVPWLAVRHGDCIGSI